MAETIRAMRDVWEDGVRVRYPADDDRRPPAARVYGIPQPEVVESRGHVPPVEAHAEGARAGRTDWKPASYRRRVRMGIDDRD